jgi:hypothetical protein
MSAPAYAEVEPRGFSWRRAFAFATVLWAGMLLVDIGKDSLAAWLLDQPWGWHIPRQSALWWPLLIPLTPAVFALAHRLPMRRDRWIASAGVHALAATGFALAHLFMSRVVVLYRIDLLNGELLWRTFRTSFNSFFLFDVLVYVALVAGYWAMDYYRRYRNRSLAAARAESLAAKARFDALRWQLNPHFLFNSLNAVAGLVRSGDSKGGVEMLARISTLLRSTLEESNATDVTLARELELVELYTEIERVRFRDRLTVDMNVDDELLDAMVPALILQPLVENAVRRGVPPTDCGCPSATTEAGSRKTPPP